MRIFFSISITRLFGGKCLINSLIRCQKLWIIELENVPGFLAFKFSCLQYITHAALRLVFPSSSYYSYLPVGNTYRGSHCLLNYIQLHSSISVLCLSAPSRFLIPSIASLLSLTTSSKSWMFCPAYLLLSLLHSVSKTPHPMCFLSSSYPEEILIVKD